MHAKKRVLKGWHKGTHAQYLTLNKATIICLYMYICRSFCNWPDMEDCDEAETKLFLLHMAA